MRTLLCLCVVSTCLLAVPAMAQVNEESAYTADGLLKPTGNPAVDMAVGTVNAINRAMKMMDEEANLHLKAAEYANQVADLQQQVNGWKVQLKQLERQV